MKINKIEIKSLATIVPVGNRILVEPEPDDEKVNGIIIKGETYLPRIQTVVAKAVGDGTMFVLGDHLERRKTVEVKVGDRLMIDRGAGLSVGHGNDKHKFIMFEDIIAILKPEKTSA